MAVRKLVERGKPLTRPLATLSPSDGERDGVRGCPHPTAPVRELTFVNLQRTKPINSRQLRAITEAALVELGITRWNLTFYLVGAKKMADINEDHLGHDGPTDVITFNYSDHASRITHHVLLGEIFICSAVAVTHAREFRTTWQSELVRYIVHALLHLCGHDDLKTAARREMKRHENRLVRKLANRFRFADISKLKH